MRWLLVMFCLFMLVVPVAHAQTDLPPILALYAGGIYAVSPVDGSVQTLVAPPADYEVSHDETRAPVTVFSAEWLSPDGQYLAFRAMRSDAPAEAQASGGVIPHALYVLDVQHGGDPLPATLLNDPAGTYAHVESVAWSADGARLYAAIVTFDTASTEQLGWSLVYVERGAWDHPVAVPIPDLEHAMARRIFAAGDGMVVMDRGIQSPRYVFTLLDPAGQQVSHFELHRNVPPGVNLYVNTPFTSLRVDDTLRFGLVNMWTGELAGQVDFVTGDVTPFDRGYFPGMVSDSAPDSSLRVLAGYYSGDLISLLIRDDSNGTVGETDIFRAFAFGILGHTIGSTFALSPDGQALAYLDDGALMFWHDGTATALDFTAEALAWGSARYIAIYDPEYLAG
jgi:hypothetical protein